MPLMERFLKSFSDFLKLLCHFDKKFTSFYWLFIFLFDLVLLNNNDNNNNNNNNNNSNNNNKDDNNNTYKNNN